MDSGNDRRFGADINGGAASLDRSQASMWLPLVLGEGDCETYRVFVTNLDAPIDVVVGFYRQRAGAENLIKEANNDAGLAAHPSARWSINCVHFQLAMLAYNLNCWLMLFNREEQAKLDELLGIPVNVNGHSVGM
jgi:hypothetical protein